jgi:hypothetical protein
MMEENAILELIFKDDFAGTKIRILVERHPSHVPGIFMHIQVVMKRHPSLGSVGCVDCGIYGENCAECVMEGNAILELFFFK